MCPEAASVKTGHFINYPSLRCSLVIHLLHSFFNIRENSTNCFQKYLLAMGPAVCVLKFRQKIDAHQLIFASFLVSKRELSPRNLSKSMIIFTQIHWLLPAVSLVLLLQKPLPSTQSCRMKCSAILSSQHYLTILSNVLCAGHGTLCSPFHNAQIRETTLVFAIVNFFLSEKDDYNQIL